MLIVEIILTVLAWRRGWKWLALLPVGIALLIGFAIGFGIGLSGGDASSISGGTVVIDVLAIVALVIMLIYKREEKPLTDEKETSKTLEL